MRAGLLALTALAGCGEPPFVLDARITTPDDHVLSAAGRPLDSEAGDAGVLVHELRRTWRTHDDALAASPIEIGCESQDGCGPFSLPVTACRRYDIGRLLELEASYSLDAGALVIVTWTCRGDAGEVSGSAAPGR